LTLELGGAQAERQGLIDLYPEERQPAIVADGEADRHPVIGKGAIGELSPAAQLLHALSHPEPRQDIDRRQEIEEREEELDAKKERDEQEEEQERCEIAHGSAANHRSSVTEPL
jgi:ABC-type glutathione transport system ATPase component